MNNFGLEFSPYPSCAHHLQIMHVPSFSFFSITARTVETKTNNFTWGSLCLLAQVLVGHTRLRLTLSVSTLCSPERNLSIDANSSSPSAQSKPDQQIHSVLLLGPNYVMNTTKRTIVTSMMRKTLCPSFKMMTECWQSPCNDLSSLFDLAAVRMVIPLPPHPSSKAPTILPSLRCVVGLSLVYFPRWCLSLAIHSVSGCAVAFGLCCTVEGWEWDRGVRPIEDLPLLGQVVGHCSCLRGTE